MPSLKLQVHDSVLLVNAKDDAHGAAGVRRNTPKTSLPKLSQHAGSDSELYLDDEAEDQAVPQLKKSKSMNMPVLVK